VVVASIIAEQRGNNFVRSRKRAQLVGAICEAADTSGIA
jgi:hypothetical protein